MKKFGFTYIFTDNIAKMKWFYGDILGLELIWDQVDNIAFKICDHQLSIKYHDGIKAQTPDFSIQPGWQGGTEPRTSWSIDYDADGFKDTVRLLLKHEVKSCYTKPHWNGYWSFPVLDPMNNTIEITCSDIETYPVK